MQAIAKLEDSILNSRIQNFQNQDRIQTFQPHTLINATLAYRGHTLAEVNNRKRTKDIAYTRQLLTYLLYSYTRLTLNQIGEMLCKENPYDHTTIIHGRDKLRRLSDVYQSTVDDVNEILRLASGNVAAA